MFPVDHLMIYNKKNDNLDAECVQFQIILEYIYIYIYIHIYIYIYIYIYTYIYKSKLGIIEHV